MIATRIRGVESKRSVSCGRKGGRKRFGSVQSGAFRALTFFSCESLEGKCALLSLLLRSRTVFKASSGILEVKSAQMANEMRENRSKTEKSNFVKRLR